MDRGAEPLLARREGSTSFVRLQCTSRPAFPRVVPLLRHADSVNPGAGDTPLGNRGLLRLGAYSTGYTLAERTQR